MERRIFVLICAVLIFSPLIIIPSHGLINDLTKSEILVSSDTMASGASNKILIRAEDSLNQNISNVDVYLSITAGKMTNSTGELLTISSDELQAHGKTNASGYLNILYQSPSYQHTSGNTLQVTIQASLEIDVADITISKSITIEDTSAKISNSQLILPTDLIPDNLTLSTIVMDSNNNPVSGVPVEFTASAGNIISGSTGYSDSNGNFSVIYQKPTLSQSLYEITVNITAVIQMTPAINKTLSGSLFFTLQTTGLVISYLSNTVVNENTTLPVTIKVTDQNNTPLNDAELLLSTDSGNFGSSTNTVIYSNITGYASVDWFSPELVN